MGTSDHNASGIKAGRNRKNQFKHNDRGKLSFYELFFLGAALLYLLMVPT